MCLEVLPEVNLPQTCHSPSKPGNGIEVPRMMPPAFRLLCSWPTLSTQHRCIKRKSRTFLLSATALWLCLLGHLAGICRTPNPASGISSLARSPEPQSPPQVRRLTFRLHVFAGLLLTADLQPHRHCDFCKSLSYHVSFQKHTPLVGWVGNRLYHVMPVMPMNINLSSFIEPCKRDSQSSFGFVSLCAFPDRPLTTSFHPFGEVKATLA